MSVVATPGRPASRARISGESGVCALLDAPSSRRPSPRMTLPAYRRLWLELAIVASQGLICDTGACVSGGSVEGPELPPEVATNTPALATPRKACSVGSSKAPPPAFGPIEKLMTLTPSFTAWSMAATLSAVAQPLRPVDAAVQQTLYTARRARRHARHRPQRHAVYAGHHAMIAARAWP